MAGTFINKIYTLKSSESEELIFIRANHEFFHVLFYFLPLTTYQEISTVLENAVCVSHSLHVSHILAEECLLSWFSRTQCV